MTPETVSAIEMRKKFGSLLDRVAQKGKHIAILRGEKTLAVLISAKEYEEKFQRGDKLKRLEEVLEEIEAWKLRKKIEPSRQESSEMIRQMRASR